MLLQKIIVSYLDKVFGYRLLIEANTRFWYYLSGASLLNGSVRT